jgi:catechol 1,2-dioxygenase
MVLIGATRVSEATRTSPADITANVIASFDGCRDPRLRELLQSLVRHLHEFVVESGLTQPEWQVAIDALTRTGEITDECRQEFILWSDALGLSMLVDALGHPLPAGATESTVLGPFYAPGSPLREYGANIAELMAGVPAWIHGRVVDVDTGSPVAGAELDVWQNGENRLYAVQDPDVPEHHLRGRFHTREDGSFAFLTVRPVPYSIPDDGPVGTMLHASERHPWRPAHIHLVVRATGYVTLVTHIFDQDSEYLDSDAVFAVKSSLIRRFEQRAADDPDRPPGIDRAWCSVHTDIVIARGVSSPVEDDGRTA